jgi:hypothetical protein
MSVWRQRFSKFRRDSILAMQLRLNGAVARLTGSGTAKLSRSCGQVHGARSCTASVVTQLLGVGLAPSYGAAGSM